MCQPALALGHRTTSIGQKSDAACAHRFIRWGMTNSELALLALKASITLTVFTVGLRQPPADLLYVSRHRSLFLRSMGSMYVAMPLVALWMALVLPLHPAVKLSLVAMSVSPVPPLLPGKAGKSGADVRYAASLFVISCVLSIVTVPAALWLFGELLGVAVAGTPVAPTRLIWSSVLLPLFAGLALRAMSSRLAAKLERPLGILASGILALGALLLMAVAWRPMLSLLGNGTIIAIVVFALIGLAAGYRLGGSQPSERMALAMATASRHPAVAITAATAMTPAERLAPAAVLLTMIAGSVLSAILVRIGETGAQARGPS